MCPRSGRPAGAIAQTDTGGELSNMDGRFLKINICCVMPRSSGQVSGTPAGDADKEPLSCAHGQRTEIREPHLCGVSVRAL